LSFAGLLDNRFTRSWTLASLFFRRCLLRAGNLARPWTLHWKSPLRLAALSPGKKEEDHGRGGRARAARKHNRDQYNPSYVERPAL